MAEGHHEIVIIRRGGHGEHDEHHGGVWKIAFADFMTAMMAFFLVLWLISANDKTRASVARYFNPVRLVDSTTQPRGLHDTAKDDSGITASPDTKENKESDKGKELSQGKPGKTPGPETAKGREKRLDAELRDNPYVALGEIAGDKGPGVDIKQGPAFPTSTVGRGGAAFRDPFAPPPPPPPQPSTAGRQDPDNANPPAANDTPEASKTSPKPVDEPREAENQKEVEVQKQTDALKSKVVTALKSLGTDQGGPAIDVKTTSEGTLLSLTDTTDYTMFANGSAVPSKRVVLMMEKLGQILKDKPGPIIIRGFTDNKKFRSGRYDNWHLSLDRAQVAHYMLVRGGLADERVSHVEGHADHDPRPGIDSASPLNRRIEILLKSSAT